jgi:hypothetical protein
VISIFKTAASIALLILSTGASAYAQKAESPAALPVWNDNSLIEIQAKGGDPARPGNVTIEFYGHDAFKIASPAG